MSQPEAAPAYRVHYIDDIGREWYAKFITDQEALDQAAIGVLAYGGTAPQAVLDRADVVVHDQAAIIARSEEIAG